MNIGTLFSGIGAPEFALKSLGIKYNVVFACDNDPHVKETYLANHNPQTFYDDVTKIEWLPSVNLLVFGFPCQPYSLAGKGKGLRDIRGQLLLTALDLIEGNPPDTVIAENVEGLLYQDDGKVLDYIIQRFEKMGYNVKCSVLNALDFGLPQRRNRLWIVATKQKGFTFPLPIGEHPSLKSFLNGKADPFTFVTAKFLSKPKVKRKLETYTHDYINCITHTMSRKGSSSEYISYVAAVHHAIGQLRIPTVNECCKLFGFPQDFHFPKSIATTRRYDMLGNSMAVPVLGAIFSQLVKLS